MRPGVFILHDNARPHVEKVCVEAIARKMREVLEHPACISDLSLCGYHIFEPLKKSLMSQRFYSHDDVKAVILNWFHDKPILFSLYEIRNLPKQWNTCRNAKGDYL
ncbi:histone-lysine N-methyltransferase SETMAR [Trichonephila clavipes]|nr:histone-lysine N-methyltransferase SETMAR [Trichonephila clavipes]